MALFTWPPISVSASSGPQQFNYNGAATTVSQDTVTPSNSRPLPVATNDVSYTGSITTTGTIFPSGGMAEGAVVVTGTFVGTVAIQGSADGGTTWAALATQLGGGGNPWTSAGQTAPGEYKITGIPGYPLIRILFSAYTSGSATYSLNLSPRTTIVSVRQTLAANLNGVMQQGARSATAQAWLVDGSAVTQPVSGTVAVSNQPTTMTVTQATGTNLHAVIDSGTVSVSNQITGFATSALQTQISGQLPATLGQKAMAASLPVAIASDQSTLPVNVPETSTSVALTAANTNLTTGTPTAGSFVTLTGLQGMSTGIVEVTTAGTATLAAYVSHDGGTTRVVVPLHNLSSAGSGAATSFSAASIVSYKFDIAGANTIYIFCTAFTSTTTVTLRASARPAVVNVNGGTIALAAGSNTIGTVLQLGGASGNSPGTTTASTTATTQTNPANAQGFILMAMSDNTVNIRYRIGATATATSGQRLEPGRDSGYVPCNAAVSIIAESGTPSYDIQWIVR